MIELDCRGMRCPQPIIELARRIKTLPLNTQLTLLSDDPATQPDVSAWARMTGNSVEVAGENRFLVTKAKMN